MNLGGHELLNDDGQLIDVDVQDVHKLIIAAKICLMQCKKGDETERGFNLILETMTYVIDRKTKKIVHGPTDTGDAKLYLKKQIQPRKFMIRQIRGAAKKVGDTV